MAIEGSVIDVSILEALIELRKQQALVDQYCQRAEERKEKVEAAVYARVLEDYGRRRTALEQEAAPLVTRAIAEYRKLRATYNEIQATNDAARLDKEEVEFRHALGEIDDAQKTERLKDPERILAETASSMQALDAQESLFKEALPGTDLAALAAAPPEPAAAPPAPPAPEPPPVAAAAAGPETAAIAASAGEEAVEFAEGADATILEMAVVADLPAPTAATVSGARAAAAVAVAEAPPVAPPPLPAAEPEPMELEDRTFIVPEAVLQSEADNGQSVNFRLTALTYIGRSEDNQLRLLDPGVSRRHVLIMAAPGGYTIRDLGSQNGTYVNGERIDEGPLADGDRITIGEVNLVFRAGPGH